MSAAACSCATASRNSCTTKAVPAADVITPNQFELDYLSGRASTTLGAGARRGQGGARSGAARDPGHLAAHRRDAGGCHRPAGLRRQRLFPPAHAETAAGRERGGRRHRRAVLCALSAQPAASTRRCRAPPPPSSACWPRPRRRARAKSSSLPRRMRSSIRAACSKRKKSAHDRNPSTCKRMPPSVFHVDRLELAFTPKPWAFAVERRAEIDAYFASNAAREAGAVERPRAAAASVRS